MLRPVSGGRRGGRHISGQGQEAQPPPIDPGFRIEDYWESIPEDLSVGEDGLTAYMVHLTAQFQLFGIIMRNIPELIVFAPGRPGRWKPDGLSPLARAHWLQWGRRYLGADRAEEAVARIEANYRQEVNRFYRAHSNRVKSMHPDSFVISGLP